MLSSPPRAPSSSKIERVAIVGAGFSGTIQAINLLRHDGPGAILVERRPQAGRGTAYSALLDEHLLNVRASNMSAFPDDPTHFVRWLSEKDLGGGADFVSRRTYGDYLSGLLEQTAARSPGKLTILCDDAIEADFREPAVHLTLAGGRKIEADALILAIGNLEPHQIGPIAEARLTEDVYAGSPWSHTIADGLGKGDDVLVLGTGLTMVDVVLFLDAKGFDGRIFAMSRRGLLPQAHSTPPPAPSRLSEKPRTLSSGLVRSVRARGAETDWRNAVDELRPYTQNIWRAASIAERNRFLRHLRPWWDVHRHRIAPQVAERIRDLRRSGRLIPIAGKISRVTDQGGYVDIRWRRRGENPEEMMRVRRIINCTGPQGDLQRTSEPLLRNLIAGGLIRPDPHRLGIDVNQQGEVIGADGVAHPRLFAVGPMTRGAFWEIVAVPDIRVQTWALARRLSDAHWVEGEGL